MRYQRFCRILTRESKLVVYTAGVSGTTPATEGCISPPGAMLTSEGEVEEKLRRMNDVPGESRRHWGKHPEGED